jgi:hypothetical protein
LARRFAGEPDSPVDSEIVWADSRIRTEAEITDAVIKKFQAGLIPTEQALEDLGYSQTQIARMAAMKPSEIVTSKRATELVVPAPGSTTETPTPPEATQSPTPAGG